MRLMATYSVSRSLHTNLALCTPFFLTCRSINVIHNPSFSLHLCPSLSALSLISFAFNSQILSPEYSLRFICWVGCLRGQSRETSAMIQRTTRLHKLVRSIGVGSSLSSSSKLRVHCCFGSVAASNAEQACEQSVESYNVKKNEYADVDWDNLGFGLTPTDYMYVMKCSNNGTFEKGQLNRYGNIELNPAAGVLNYGQGLYEGTKAYRKKDGNLILFRPDQNAMRMQFGAERMCMPSPSVDQFIDAVKQTVQANKCWVPPPGKGSLYIRPLLIGSGPILGLAPSPEYTFLVYASPVRNYFKEGSAPLNIYVEEEYDRASRGGAGGVKSITNYAPVLKALLRAKNRGFSDVLYLDSVNNKNLEEVSSCNIFIVKGNLISTPAAVGTILPGVTRRSIIEIARDLCYQVEERPIPVDELSEADEVFCTGTAVGVAPVGSITCHGKRMEYKTGAQTVCTQLYSTLVGIQTGHIEDKKAWIVEIE